MRLLITSHPGRGHLYPTVAVGVAARNRGHDVAVATGPAYEWMVDQAGLQFFAAGKDWDQSAGDQPLWGETTALFAADLDPIVRSWKPDVILREETELAGWIVADAHHLPFATLGLGGNLPPQAFHRGGEHLTALRRRMGAPPDPQMQSINRYLYLDQYPAGWVPPDLRPAGVYHTIGAAVMTERTAQTPRPDAGRVKRPVDEEAAATHLYATLGTVYAQQPRLIETIIEALAALDVTATITLGPLGDPGQFPAPPDIQVARFIAQDELLSHSAAVVCHAGTGTVLGALRYGLPLVLIPIAANQGWTAELAERAGVGLRLMGAAPRPGGGPWMVADLESINAADVTAAVQAVLGDESYRAQAEEAGRQLRQRWQSGIAISLLERLAATGQPVTAQET